jgi:hypothetical protein
MAIVAIGLGGFQIGRKHERQGYTARLFDVWRNSSGSTRIALTERSLIAIVQDVVKRPKDTSDDQYADYEEYVQLTRDEWKTVIPQLKVAMQYGGWSPEPDSWSWPEKPKSTPQLR